MQAPAIFLVGFIPMLLAASAYRELNEVAPDAGTSFTWTVKAFGPHVGWLCGWGLVAAIIIVLSNLAGVAVTFFYLSSSGTAHPVSRPTIRRLPACSPTCAAMSCRTASCARDRSASALDAQHVGAALHLLAVEREVVLDAATHGQPHRLGRPVGVG